MEQYARNDTRYLRPLAELLRAELKAKERLAWMRESCAQLIDDTSQDKAVDPETVWRLKGSDRLTPKALLILRELWHWREAEAREANRPPYFVLSHEHLVALAAKAAHSSNLEDHLPNRITIRRRASLVAALKHALKKPASQYPALRQHRGRRMSRAEQHRMLELRARRDQRAKVLGLDPSLIASRGTLATLARNGAATAENLMNWQRELLFGN
jgi:ribonuclease D